MDITIFKNFSKFLNYIIYKILLNMIISIFSLFSKSTLYFIDTLTKRQYEYIVI